MKTTPIRLPFATLALCLLSALASTSAQDAPPKQTPAPTGPLTFDTVVEIARAKAAEPYRDPEAAAPAFLQSISREQWEKTTFRPDKALWHGDDLPFEATLFHPGSIHRRPVEIYIVENGLSSAVPFSADLFEYPSTELRDQAAKAAPGFAGLTLRRTPDSDDAPFERRDTAEIAAFLGASYFQSRGRHSRYGVYARALAVDTALPDGEEFPHYSRFWLVKPLRGDTSFTLYAQLDSPRMTGAMRITVTPGLSTVMHVTQRLFPRAGAPAPAKLGIAPLTSMFLYSETDNGRQNEYRPEVHNSDGLLIATRDNEWQWRPLTNPNRLIVNRFPLENPRGFGLMQRDDNFDHYQDLDARFDRRPSLWVEPQGEWGGGMVELVEIPGSEDYHGNIVAFWIPETKAAPGGKAADAPAPLEHSYRLYWMQPGANPHNLGRATATRRIRRSGENAAEFLIDFDGEQLNALAADTGLASLVETPEQFPVVEKTLVKNEATSGWRLGLKIRIPSREGILHSLFSSTREENNRARIKVRLKQGENLPGALTETWVYDLHQ